MSFDLAWGSDTATWMRLARTSGIVTPAGCRVRWRSSDENISGTQHDRAIDRRKMRADAQFILWARRFFVAEGLVYPLSLGRTFDRHVCAQRWRTTIGTTEKCFDLVSLGWRWGGIVPAAYGALRGIREACHTGHKGVSS